MIVCLCHQVSERHIHDAVSDGTRCFEQLQDETRVGASCGACLDCARQTFDDACASGSARRAQPLAWLSPVQG